MPRRDSAAPAWLESSWLQWRGAGTGYWRPSAPPAALFDGHQGSFRRWPMRRAPLSAPKAGADGSTRAS
jgi:hypothetical protein